jgi:Eukaryotic aspartyl protease
MLGLNPRPTNFTDLNHPQTSYVSLLKEQNYIPSLSYSYTAGAQYRPRTVLGSLVLGGYDQSRSSTSSFISLPFFSDQSRDLTIGLQSISTNATGSQTNLLTSGIYAFIDSSIAELWLPLSVCQAFESTFGLTYNTTNNLYLVNDTLHNQLLSSNPSVSMILGSSSSGGSTINVTLPYASFNLQAQYPLVSNGASWYFPLQRAANESQYTLGRAFLQEAHLIVDYERGNFTVRPCVWTSDPEYIVTIPSINSTTSTSTGGNSSTPTGGGGGSSQTTTPGTSQSLSSGALAGIAIGAVVIAAGILGAAFYFVYYKPRHAQRKVTELDDTGMRPSSKGRAEVGDDSKSWMPELQGKFAGSEVEGSSPAPGRAELHDSKSPAGAELPTSPGAAEVEDLQIFEMPGSDVPEMDSGAHGRRPQSESWPKDEKKRLSFEQEE